MKKIKFKSMQYQKDNGNEWGLDDGLIDYIHVIANNPEFTLCGQANTEYFYDVVKSKIDCPNCLAEIKHVKDIIKQEKVS